MPNDTTMLTTNDGPFGLEIECTFTGTRVGREETENGVIRRPQAGVRFYTTFGGQKYQYRDRPVHPAVIRWREEHQ